MKRNCKFNKIEFATSEKAPEFLNSCKYSDLVSFLEGKRIKWLLLQCAVSDTKNTRGVSPEVIEV